ncbi:hypothetical protein ANCCAN_06630 [Ancylostoma caninum]|uniref:Peptidase C1A papain C-terminal domain-containing protein n=1 Tax=Ancylostoma caninum TaxID=29170 RepID=A0A368GSH5_ANCCA|nr:hypothetical protein ANCCAN_06630 [Ancylostoma caninum]
MLQLSGEELRDLERTTGKGYCIYLVSLFLGFSCIWPPLVPMSGPVFRTERKALSGKALADYVDQNQKLFKAESNGKADVYKDKLMDLRFVGRGPSPKEEYLSMDSSNVEIPESFDARSQWPDCPSLRNIRDQANCGSCWAFASTEAMSDRICIASKATKKVLLSADDLLSCCLTCRDG